MDGYDSEERRIIFAKKGVWEKVQFVAILVAIFSFPLLMFAIGKRTLKRFYGHLDGFADWITLSRIPLLVLAIYGIYIYNGPDQVWWYVVGCYCITNGMIKDAEDGWWARKVQAFTTPFGKYIDQLIDKVFIWPLILLDTAQYHLSWSLDLDGFRCYTLLSLLIADLVSAGFHTYDWWMTGLPGKNHKNSGAISYGKRKFVLMCIFMCFGPASRAPDVYILKEIAWFADQLVVLIYVLPVVALGYALVSLYKRGKKLFSITSEPPTSAR